MDLEKLQVRRKERSNSNNIINGNNMEPKNKGNNMEPKNKGEIEQSSSSGNKRKIETDLNIDENRTVTPKKRKIDPESNSDSNKNKNDEMEVMEAEAKVGNIVPSSTTSLNSSRNIASVGLLKEEKLELVLQTVLLFTDLISKKVFIFLYIYYSSSHSHPHPLFHF
jgi:hypothetical protein